MNVIASVITVIVGFSLALILVSFVLPYFASVGVFSSAQGAAITSVGTTVLGALPLLAILVISGLALFVFSRGR